MKVFGDFEFDEKSMQLRRAGQRVSIPGQCLDLLAMMLARPGELLTREEIRALLWPDRNVDFEHGLDVLVNRLRIVLGDSGKTARYIQTVPRKGYRFVEQVKIGPSRYAAPSGATWTRRVARYVAVAVLAALLALLFARMRYERFVPPPGAPAPASSR